VWDTKRQIIWLATGVVLGTFFLYPQARDELGVTDWSYFALLELLLLAVIGVMFYIYSRKK
jgi:nitric oxide reductase large subunit